MGQQEPGDTNLEDTKQEPDRQTNSQENQLIPQDFEDLMHIILDKQARVEELENALRESVQISTEQDEIMRNEREKRIKILEKVSDVIYKFLFTFKLVI